MARNIPPGFMLYEESIKLLSSMPTEKAGEIIQAACGLYLDGTVTEIKDPLYKAILEGVTDKMTRDAADYAKKCEQNKEKALKRWHGEEERNERGTISTIRRIGGGTV